MVNKRPTFPCSPKESEGLMEKVKQYAKENGITFLIDHANESKYGTAYIQERQKPTRNYLVVVMGESFNSHTMDGIYASLHEFGHWLDFHVSGSLPLIRKVGKGEVEITAWENAFQLAVEFGLTKKQIKQMYEQAKWCINSYLGEYNGKTFTHKKSIQFGYFGEEPEAEQAFIRLNVAKKKALKEVKRNEKQRN